MNYIATFSNGLGSQRIEESQNHQTRHPVRNRKAIITCSEWQRTWLGSLKGPVIILKSVYKINSLVNDQSWDKAVVEHCCYFVRSEVMGYLIKCAVASWALLSVVCAEAVFATRLSDSFCQPAYVHSYGQTAHSETSTKHGVSAHLQHWFWSNCYTVNSFICIYTKCDHIGMCVIVTNHCENVAHVLFWICFEREDKMHSCSCYSSSSSDWECPVVFYNQCLVQSLSM